MSKMTSLVFATREWPKQVQLHVLRYLCRAARVERAERRAYKCLVACLSRKLWLSTYLLPPPPVLERQTACLVWLHHHHRP